MLSNSKFIGLWSLFSLCVFFQHQPHFMQLAKTQSYERNGILKVH